MASAAMVFKFYGIDVDPQQLNWFLTATGGYTEQGWLYWDRAAWFAPDRVRHVYEDLPSYQLIDSNIAHGNPVIVRVRLGSGITHFVVIAGKDGFDYLVRDPGAGSAKGLYPLRRTRQRYRGAAILPAHRQNKFERRSAALTAQSAELAFNRSPVRCAQKNAPDGFPSGALPACLGRSVLLSRGEKTSNKLFSPCC